MNSIFAQANEIVEPVAATPAKSSELNTNSIKSGDDVKEPVSPSETQPTAEATETVEAATEPKPVNEKKSEIVPPPAQAVENATTAEPPKKATTEPPAAIETKQEISEPKISEEKPELKQPPETQEVQQTQQPVESKEPKILESLSEPVPKEKAEKPVQKKPALVAKKKATKSKFNWKSLYRRHRRISGFSAGVSLGQFMSNAEFLSSGPGVGLFAEWRHNRYLAINASFATGQYAAKNFAILATDSNGTNATINQNESNSLGFWNAGLGLQFYYPVKKFTPGLGLGLLTNKLQGPSYAFESWLSLNLEASLWYNVWRKLDVGFITSLQTGSVQNLNVDGNNFTLNDTVSAGNLNLRLSAKYKIF